MNTERVGGLAALSLQDTEPGPPQGEDSPLHGAICPCSGLRGQTAPLHHLHASPDRGGWAGQRPSAGRHTRSAHADGPIFHVEGRLESLEAQSEGATRTCTPRELAPRLEILLVQPEFSFSFSFSFLKPQSTFIARKAVLWQDSIFRPAGATFWRQPSPRLLPSRPLQAAWVPGTPPGSGTSGGRHTARREPTCQGNHTHRGHRAVHGSLGPGVCLSAQAVGGGRVPGQALGATVKGHAVHKAGSPVGTERGPLSKSVCWAGCAVTAPLTPGSHGGCGAVSSPRRSNNCAAAAPRLRTPACDPPHMSSTASSARTSPLDTPRGTPSSLLSPA